MRKGYATQGAVQPGPVFMEDAEGNRYDEAGNIVPPDPNAVSDALSVARREVTDPYAEEVASGKKMLTDQQYKDQSWSDWAGDIGKNLYNTGMAFLPTALGGQGAVGLSDIAKGAYESAKSGVTLPGDVLMGKTNVFDPATGDITDEAMRRGMDFTGLVTMAPSSIPAEANTLRMGMKGAVGPEDTEAAALKAAQEAAGKDQAALALKTAQEPLPFPPIGHNVPPAKTLLETFDEENLPGVVVSPKPGTGGFTFATPDIIGMPVPPPMYNPIRKADVRPIAKDAEKILNSPGFRKYAEEQLGVSGFDVTPTIGTWMGNPEPSFIIQGGNITPESARKLTSALGFGFQQDAAVLTMHNPSISDGIPTMLMGTGRELTKSDVNRIMKSAQKHGLDFTLTKDGRAVRFSHFDGPETLSQFADKIAAIAEEAKMPELLGVKTQGDLINADQYINGLVPEAPSGAGIEYGPGQSPDLFGGLVDTVLVPFSKSAAGQGYRLSPERLGQQYAIGPDIEARVAQGLLPRGDRSTVPLMEGREKLPIKGTGARGEVVVDDVIDALSNRAARKGYIEPGDYSPKAMATIAKTIADEVYHHVTTSGKSALGWYDATLKKAKGAYQRIFPELSSDPQRNMLFDAILGITSQGADVYTNSKNAVRLYNLVRDGQMTLPQAVSKLSGTLGKETAAVEQNLLKLDELLSRNGYGRMADLFNQTKTVGEWNKIFRDDKSLYVKGKPFQIKGGKNQKVTGWMVFGPKIGSFINNLHGDYSTLTADLWFTRSWNRILGNSFIHDAGTEAAQFRDFRDALKAEYAKTHDIRDPLMRQKYSPDVSGYSQKLVRGKQSGEPWEFGQDVASMPPEEFNSLLNDPDAMLQYAYNLEQVYRKGGYKEKSDLRRRAKNWIEGRENAQVNPRADLERAFQQDTIEQTQKLLKKRGLDISVADIQAALWYYEKDLFGKYGVASEKAAPADYFDAAQKTLKSFDEGNLYKNEASTVKDKISPKQKRENFEAAFGQTYLKDPSGKPMRLYHLTPQDITEFSASPQNRAGPVVFLSPYADYQPAYHQAGVMGPRGEFTQDFREGANVMPVYADVRNPLVLDHPRKIREAAAKYQGGDREFPRYISPEAKAAMEADGYDAIIYGGDNPIPYGDRPMDARLGHQEARDEEFIIFDPRKIKSAVSNRGTYDTSNPDITKALGGSIDDEDIDNALRLARAMGGRIGYAEAGSVPVFMEDSKGNKYDAQGNVIPPTNPGPNPQRSDVTPQSLAAKGVNDPATYDALMERFAIPDRDVAEYEALKTAVAQQPKDIQQMTHVGERPRREVSVDMPLFGGEYKMGSAPYDVAGPMSGMAQTAYDLKTAPLYATPAAPFALAADTAEGVMTGDPLSASLAIGFGPGGKYAKAAGIGAVNYLMAPDQAEAGPERWFSKAMEIARELPMNKMTGEQALAMLRKGTSPEELRWMGADVFLPQQKQITKDDLLKYLQEKRIQTHDIEHGGAKPTNIYDVFPSDELAKKYQPRLDAVEQKLQELEAQKLASDDLPFEHEDYIGAYTYRSMRDELLNEKAGIEAEMRDEAVKEMGGLAFPTRYHSYATPGGEAYGETLITLPDVPGSKIKEYQVYGAFPRTFQTEAEANKYVEQLNSMLYKPEWEGIADSLRQYPPSVKPVYESGQFQSGHWQAPNVIAHVRSQILDATPPGANRPYKAWNADEFQSDWGQAGRKEGFKNPEVDRRLSEIAAQRKELDNKIASLASKADEDFKAAQKPFRDQADAEEAALMNEYRKGNINMIVFKNRMNEVHDRYLENIAEFKGRRNANYYENIKPLEAQRNALVNEHVDLSSKSGKISPAPYVQSTEGWTDLAIKKALDKALDSNADYFTWSPGEVHAERYSLDKHIEGLAYDPETGVLDYRPKGSSPYGWESFGESIPPDKLGSFVGKEVAEKLLASPKGGGVHMLTGVDLKVGGEGMRGYYNSMVPKRVTDIIRKATGEKPVIETITVQTANGPRQQLGVRLTDEMREKARFSDFNKGGRVEDHAVNKALALTSEY